MFPQVVRTPWHFNAGVGAVHLSIASFRTRVGAWPQAMSGLGQKQTSRRHLGKSALPL
jgi:hypothetical protein